MFLEDNGVVFEQDTGSFREDMGSVMGEGGTDEDVFYFTIF